MVLADFFNFLLLHFVFVFYFVIYSLLCATYGMSLMLNLGSICLGRFLFGKNMRFLCLMEAFRYFFNHRFLIVLPYVLFLSILNIKVNK